MDRPITLSSSLVAVCCSSATRQLAVARLQLGEQADVLDGDDGLVGEGLQQRDLLVGEGPRLAAPDMIAPIGVAFAEHRDGQRGRCAIPVSRQRRCTRILRVRAARSWTCTTPPVEDRAAGHACRGRIGSGYVAWRCGDSGVDAVIGDQCEAARPRPERMAPSVASHSRAALSAIVSKHRLHVGRRAQITRRISLVAVCCSSASVRSRFLRLQLGEQPRVLDGDGGLVGEGLHSAICLSVNGRDLVLGGSRSRRCSAPSRSIGTARPSGTARPARHVGIRVVGVGPDVVDVDRPPLEHGPSRPLCRGRRDRDTARRTPRASEMRRSCATTSSTSPSNAVDQASVGVAQTHRILDQRLEAPAGDRTASRLISLRISLVAVCCSSATRQLAVAGLQLGEQPHVLDGDDRLVGEGLQELDLLVREGPDLRAPDSDRADRPRPRAASGRPSDRPIAGLPRRPWSVGNSSSDSAAQVVRCGSTSIDDRAIRHRRGRRAAAARAGGPNGMWPMMSRRWTAIVHRHRKTLASCGIAQPRRALGHRVEHRLQVGRRAEITRRISLVAVCCSSASVRSRVLGLQLGEQPRVLDGDGGLVGKGLEQGDLALGEGEHLEAVDVDGAEQLAGRSIGTPISVRRGSTSRAPKVYSGSAWASWMWTVRRSRATRPTQLPRPGGMGCCSRRRAARAETLKAPTIRRS